MRYTIKLYKNGARVMTLRYADQEAQQNAARPIAQDCLKSGSADEWEFGVESANE